MARSKSEELIDQTIPNSFCGNRILELKLLPLSLKPMVPFFWASQDIVFTIWVSILYKQPHDILDLIKTHVIGLGKIGTSDKAL